MRRRIIVIGGGIGGLTTAALLAKAGLAVTVLEAHVYAGGCAGTFYHQGYRFDAGATLAAGFDENGGMTRLGELLGIAWPTEPAEIAMAVHLPDGYVVTRWTDSRRWEAERRVAFGNVAEPFWRWQGRTADLLWRAVLQGLPFPPQSATDVGQLIGTGLNLAAAAPLHLPGLMLDAFRPAAARLPAGRSRLHQYVDGQLLISAQATAARANALYAAAALDMPRRGVAHVRGGIGRLAEALVAAVRSHGGQVLFRQRATRVLVRNGQPKVVETNKDASFAADAVIFNLPPWDAAALLDDDDGDVLRRATGTQPFSEDRGDRSNLSARTRNLRLPTDGWGAFMVYVGLDGSIVPPGYPLHHQVLVREPLGEGNSVFLSLSPPDDTGRAPAGQRTLTISTHTALEPWWALFEADRAAYEARKEAYTRRVLDAAEIALPGLHAAARLIMPGTPVSFQRFTHRSLGWVGGFPQTSLLRLRGPRFGPNLWLVGDSIFPGQSVLATALGGTRVAEAIAKEAP